jgi:hypothetical protein
VIYLEGYRDIACNIICLTKMSKMLHLLYTVKIAQVDNDALVSDQGFLIKLIRVCLASQDAKVDL